MGGLILLVVCIAAICVVLGHIPSMASIKIMLMFIIGFIAIYAFIKLWDDLDGKL